jgi:hypothetical protein
VGDWMVHRSFLRFTPPERFQLERYNEGDAETRRNGDTEIG